MRGFTVVELIIVIAITAILAAAAIPLYGNLQITAQLNANTSQLTQNLRTAQTRSIAGLNGLEQGVALASNQYTLYQGTTSSVYTRTTELDSVLNLYWSLSNGTNVVEFDGSGIPTATGSLYLMHDVYGIKTITINDAGLIEEQ